MKHTGKTVVLAMLYALWLSACGSSQEIDFVEPGIKSTLAETLNVYLDANIQDTSPGVAILVVKDGEVDYVGTKGMANKHTALSIHSDTGFRLGSISKTLTALAVMQLYERGRLTLGDSILQFLPELPSSWQEITIHHLLCHQSGIPDFTNDLGIESWPDGVTNQDIVDYFATHDDLEFAPGANGEYSNTGYVLLAEVVSRLSGVRFADYMQDHFLHPLGMHQSYVADEYSISMFNEALNFAEFSTLFSRKFYVTGASGVVSSLDDMTLFMDALLNEEIVNAETLDLMQQQHTPNLFLGSHYGYGLMVDTTGADAFAHRGRNDGFVTWMLVNRENRLRLVILGNGGAQTGNHNYLTGLIDQFYGHQ
jgi:CubicO group peptidase (beta-lactamase class C family)